MLRIEFYNNIYAIFLVLSQGKIYVKDNGKIIYSRYVHLFPSDPSKYLMIIKDNFDLIYERVVKLVDGERVLFEMFKFFTVEGEINEDELRDYKKIIKNTKKINEFSPQLYSQCINWINGKHQMDIIKTVDIAQKIKKLYQNALDQRREEIIRFKTDKINSENQVNESLRLVEYYKKILNEKNNPPQCRICGEIEDLVIIIPCGHRIICLGCYKQLRKRECPICRINIDNVYKIYEC